MAKHLTGWNLYIGEHMKKTGDLVDVATLWRNASEQEKNVWNEQAKMRNLAKDVSTPPSVSDTDIEREHLSGFHYFVREQSTFQRKNPPQERLRNIAQQWRALSEVERESWKQ